MAEELARRGDAGGVAEDRIFLDEYLIARGRLRIAQGDAEQGVADLLWCGERLKALGVAVARATGGPSPRRRSPRSARRRRPSGSPTSSWPSPGGSVRPWRSGCRSAHRALTTDGDRRLRGLEEAVAVLEAGAGRLELAHALADLGAELGRARRRREGREASRRAMELAAECGATALAERARAELQSGPGRRRGSSSRGRAR